MLKTIQSYERPTLTVEPVEAEQGFATSPESVTINPYEPDGEF